MSSVLSPAAWARRSAANPWRVVAIWGVALVASLAIIATLLSSALTSSTNFIGSTESKRADHQITHQIGIHDAVTETVVIHKAGATPAELRPTVERLAQQIRGLGSGIVGGAATPWSGGAGKGLIDRSGNARAHRRSYGRLRVGRPGSHREGARARAVSRASRAAYRARDRRRRRSRTTSTRPRSPTLPRVRRSASRSR